jgi:sporulation protein YlmC with PRC-barrel domain
VWRSDPTVDPRDETPMVRDFQASDRGKTVVTTDGETLGTVQDVSEDAIHVTPDSGLADSLRQTLGWTDESEQTYRIDKSSVTEITDVEIRLQR